MAGRQVFRCALILILISISRRAARAPFGDGRPDPGMPMAFSNRSSWPSPRRASCPSPHHEILRIQTAPRIKRRSKNAAASSFFVFSTSIFRAGSETRPINARCSLNSRDRPPPRRPPQGRSPRTWPRQPPPGSGAFFGDVGIRANWRPVRAFIGIK